MKNMIVFFMAASVITLAVPHRAVAEIVTSAINNPTANVVEYGGIDMAFQGYMYEVASSTPQWKCGGLVANIAYGFTDTLNLGISFDAGNILARDGLFTSAVTFRQPLLFMKLQLFTGAFSTAVGYDGRGYRQYDAATQRHEIREKGYYLVFTKENITESLMLLTGGMNVCDFENFRINSFFSMMVKLNEKLQFAAEIDNDSKVNIGLHYLVAVESFSIDAGAKNVGDSVEYYLRFHVVKTLK